MKYQTEKGVIEVAKSSGSKDYLVIFENGDSRYGGFVFCNPVPVDSNCMNVVDEPIGAVMVFWSSEDTSSTPSFISSIILRVIN